MKYKISVIFLVLCFVLYLIYCKFDNSNTNVLYIGDSNTFYDISKKLGNYYINSYLFDDVTYDELKRYVKNNHYKIVKDKYIYLNQLIRKSDILILNANNFDYKMKCRRNDRIIEEYNLKVNKDINMLIDSINSISNIKTIVIGNYCNKNFFEFKGENFNFLSFSNIDDINEMIIKSINY